MAKSITIDGIYSENRYFLAPMAGITDSAFRTVCKEMGAGLVYTEMVSAKALTFRDQKSISLLKIARDEGPCIAQIFGGDGETCAQGAQIALEYCNPVAIDINMGCPVPKIVGNGEGSALMTDSKRAESLLKAVKKAIPIPLTVKFRKGYTADTVNAVEFAKMAESAGVSALCVHGRTRSQMYSGTSDMEIIGKVKQAVSVPVIASGDVFSPEAAQRLMDDFGADAVMAARGAMGNPFLFRQFLQYEQEGAYEKPSVEEIVAVMERHIALTCQRKGEARAIPEARKHMLWYLKGVRGAKKYKIAMTQLSTLEQVRQLLKEIKENCR